jgi:hypothetical protein
MSSWLHPRFPHLDPRPSRRPVALSTETCCVTWLSREDLGPAPTERKVLGLVSLATEGSIARSYMLRVAAMQE